MNRLIFSLLFFILIGCAGRHCIGVDGSYKGVDGQIEYCFDLENSKKSGVPTFRNGESHLLFGLEPGFLEDIEDALRGVSVKEKSQIHIVKRLKAIIEERKKR
ncbi:MAG: hypothetical protein DRI56_03175 [Chloroflexota bacterium]|nr:MAG: hypothetical protein DRI56_03175 [Chloroflexota bacterium]